MLMDSVLKDLVGTNCFHYNDDLILFIKTAEKDAEKLERVLERFDKANLHYTP
jgi:muramoyltetrapeptide carboxypeptidase LdcA involved in peptidoglycan recycling